METETLELFRFWSTGTRRCVLVSVDHQLELRLYDRRNLVGLALCNTGREAMEIATLWQEHPPTWPPF